MNAVVKRKVYSVGNGTSSAVTESLRIDVTNVSKEDIRKLMLSIVGNETTKQTRIGNPPQITEVDGSKYKPVSQVNKKIVVLFGVQLPGSALGQVERLLSANISSSTTANTGALADMNNWEWRHIRNGRQIPITGGAISFGPRDFLVLRPKLAYASAANKRVASGSKSLTYNPANSKRVAKRNQKLGFMAATARQARRVKDLVPFNVSVGMTMAFKVPGELRKIGGTAYLIITPRRGRYRG
jgi:hypothetical protein